jgi:hypothetical protein
MKTLSQIVLPIAVVAGLVFGITYLANYSVTRSGNKGGTKLLGTSERPLTLAVAVARRDPAQPFLKYWKTDFEVGEHGHFDFWFRNAHPQTVRVSFSTASCTCAGAELGIVPADAWNDYVQQSGIAGMPGLSTGPIVGALNTIALESKISWTDLKPVDGKRDGLVPAATDRNGPQMGIVRLKWEGKESADGSSSAGRRLTAKFMTQLPDTNAVALDLEALYFVVPPFQVNVGASPEQGARLGSLIAESAVKRELYIWSKTRDTMHISISPLNLGPLSDCIEIGEPELLAGPDREMFVDLLTQGGVPGEIKAVYRAPVTVHERRLIKNNSQAILRQLDVGPLKFGLQVSLEVGKAMTVTLSGVVRGDLRILGKSEDNERIEFGPSFASSESRTVETLVISDRAGLDLDLLKAECRPAYLDVSLKSQGQKEGRGQWILTVTIPPNSLFGTLEDSFVVLATKDTTPRRIRIPVKASTSSGGGPR